MAVALMVFAWWYFGRIGQSGSASKLSIGLLPAIQLGAFFWIVTASGCLAARMRIASEVTLSRLGQGAALILIYFGLKFMMVVKGVGVAFYPVLLLLSLGICLIALRTLCAPNFVRSVIAMPALGAFLAISGALTLQVYLFHSPLASLEALSSIVFPLNIAVFGLLVLIGAALVKLATDAIAGALDDLSRMSRRPIF
jgi:hypothetical protein